MALKNVASWCIVVLVWPLAGMAQTGPKSRPIAEGEYSVLKSEEKTGAGLTLDHWLMYRLPEGGFKVDVEIKTVQLPDKAEEHRTFTKAMKLAGYEWRMQSEGKADPATMRCDFTDSEARCAGKTMNGRPYSTKLAIKAPYAFMPVTDEPVFDFAWAFQSMVWQTERSANRTTSIDMISMTDGDTENGTVLGTGSPPSPGVFGYLGRDTIEVVGQKVDAHKFEVKGSKPGDGVILFWFSDAGLLLKMTGDEMGTILLSRYEGPSLTFSASH